MYILRYFYLFLHIFNFKSSCKYNLVKKICYAFLQYVAICVGWLSCVLASSRVGIKKL